MDIKPSDPPDMILTLEQLKEQVRKVMFFSGGHVPDPLYRIANALACVIDILIDDRRQAEKRLVLTSVDWMWCYENPREAAMEIERLRAALEKYADPDYNGFNGGPEYAASVLEARQAVGATRT